MLKLLLSGHALASLHQLRAEGLQHGLLPLLDVILEQPDGERFIATALAKTDARIAEGRTVSPGFLFATLLWERVNVLWARHREEGLNPIPALNLAIDEVLEAQAGKLAIHKRFVADMREIWSLQPRFERRSGQAPYRLAEHMRLRAGYDFLMLRVETGEAPEELGQWWTDFLAADAEGRAALVAAAPRSGPSRKRRRRPRRRSEQAGPAPSADGASAQHGHERARRVGRDRRRRAPAAGARRDRPRREPGRRRRQAARCLRAHRRDRAGPRRREIRPLAQRAPRGERPRLPQRGGDRRDPAGCLLAARRPATHRGRRGTRTSLSQCPAHARSRPAPVRGRAHRCAPAPGRPPSPHGRARVRAAAAARGRPRCDNSRNRPGGRPGGSPGRATSRPGVNHVPTMPDPATQPASPPPPSPFERFRHIVVEGPIGAGKTSLARRLVDTYGARAVLEDAAANPFLERFYREGR